MSNFEVFNEVDNLALLGKKQYLYIIFEFYYLKY